MGVSISEFRGEYYFLSNVPLKAPGVRFADEGVIIFDLKQATDMNQPNACTETGLCLIPTPAYPFVEMPSGYFAS